ncbi:MAG TPA: L-threonylcarbamoyladenylate synthase [Allosphingosinicella sp.]|nr:L-threonylcarbamoyladenylate synthase [Allosphingosinicella sp.]
MARQKTAIFSSDEAGLAEAARRILAGALVAVPTETVYGLAADATNAAAVARIYAAKGRPSFNPLIVHVASLDAAERIATFSPEALALAHSFWPGPLTLVLPRRADSGLAEAVSAGLPTIGVRVPRHPVMLALLAAVGRPLAAPSANASGGISPTTAEHVLASLRERAPMILDGGATERGVESTIVAAGPGGVRVLRPGPVSAEEIEAFVRARPGSPAEGRVEAPGMMASHYAPSKPVRLGAVEADGDEWLIGFGAVAGDESLSGRGDLVEAAANLFAALHRAEASERPRIAVAPVPEEGIGIAINDRLQRAAAPRGA